MCTFMCAHLWGPVPVRTSSTNSTACSQRALQLHCETHRLSIQVASVVSISTVEPKGTTIHSAKVSVCFTDLSGRLMEDIITNPNRYFLSFSFNLKHIHDKLKVFYLNENWILSLLPVFAFLQVSCVFWDVCVSRLIDQFLYKCFYPLPQCRPKCEWLSISAAAQRLKGYTVSDFWEVTTAVKCTLPFDNTCVCVRICVCMCVSTWICISDCSMQLWPQAIQPLLILRRISPPHSNLATVPPTITFTTPYWHPVVRGGTASTWCLADSGGRWRTAYKWHLPLIKSCTCWSTWSAEGLASTVTQAGPLILR